jgi:hypothetical protein
LDDDLKSNAEIATEQSDATERKRRSDFTEIKITRVISAR